MAFDAVPVTSPVTSPVKSPTKVVDVVTPVANISPSELSVIPEPTFTSEVTSKSLLIPTVPLELIVNLVSEPSAMENDPPAMLLIEKF